MLSEVPSVYQRKDVTDGVLYHLNGLYVHELELSGEPSLASARVKPPRLARSPVSLECTLLKIVEVEGTALILGRVLLYHVKDDILRGGRVDPRLATFVGRMGDDLYCRTSDLFERKRIP